MFLEYFFTYIVKYRKIFMNLKFCCSMIILQPTLGSFTSCYWSLEAWKFDNQSYQGVSDYPVTGL